VSRYDDILDAEQPEGGKYDRLLDADNGSLRPVAQATADADPEKVANALRRMRGGVPAGLAVSSPDAVIQAADQADAESRYDAILKDDAPLAEWLSRPENMAVAKDDVESLSALGKVWRAGVADPYDAARGSVIEMAGSGVSGVGRLYETADRGIDRGARALLGDRFADAFSAEVPWWLDPAEILKRPGGVIKEFGRSVMPPEERRNFATDVAGAGGQLGGYVALQIATGGAGTLALGAAQGADISGERAEAAGATQEQQDLAASAGAVITGVTERLGVAWLMRRLPKGWQDFLTKKTADVLLTGGGEAAQEYVENVANNAVAWATYDPDTNVFTPGGEEPAAGTAAAIFRAMLLGVRGRSQNADLAAAAKAKLEQADAMAEASKLRERSPEKFEEAVGKQLAAQGRETVYLPVEQFETYYQSQKVAPAEAWAHLTGDAGGYQQARATGADLQIPYAKYLARLTPEERKALTPHLRLSPEAMTAVEAEDFAENREKILGETLEARGTEQADEAYDFIYNDLLGQLLQRFPRDVADKYASAEAARFVAFNRAAGTDPLADYQANAPRIVSEVPEALRQGQFDAAIDPLLESLRANETPVEPLALAAQESLAAFLDQSGVDIATTSNEEVKKFLQSGVAAQPMQQQDQTVLEQAAHPFAGVTREQFLGNPRITKNDNAAGLVPRALKELTNVTAEPFAAGDGLTARYSDGAAAVYDGEKVVASYNFGDTLVVDKSYRRQGIAEELVYQWRMRNPGAAPAKQRTKASQALQEKVWARIERERDGGATTLNQSKPVAPEKLEAFNRWFAGSKVVDANGQPLQVYHGAQRPDRIGTRFRKSRATSGPMAFFTESAELASSYAKGKGDTSLADEDTNYDNWFKVKVGRGSPVSIDRAWWHLTPEERERIAAKAPTVRTDDDGNVIVEEGNKTGLGGFDQHLKEARGNVLKALVEEWLSSGSLFNEEITFLDVLAKAGMDTSKVIYDSPQAEYPAVLPVYLSIKNPLNTGNIDQSVFDALDKMASRSRAKPQKYGADNWDKNTRDVREWVRLLKDEYQQGKNSYVWTSIPDQVSDVLRELGYDGIKDVGGKGGGMEHTVWIPFEEGQVKSSVGNRGTFDPDSTNILYQSAAPAWPELAEAVQQRDAGTIDDRALADRVDALIDDGRAPQYLTEHSEDADFLKAAREAATLQKRGGEGQRIDTRQFLNDLLGIDNAETLFQAAFHGTPHIIGPEGFSLSKIGTGEGVQAYGWGLYFAENPVVADGYRRALSGRVPLGAPRASDSAHVAAARNLIDNGITGDDALRSLSRAYPNANEADLRLALQEANPGALYQVDIPDEATARMLDWDKPMSEQAPAVRAALHAADFNGDEVIAAWKKNGAWDHVSGQVLYQHLSGGNTGVAAAAGKPRAASMYLASIGIPGIRFLDQGSRNRPLKTIKNEILEELPEDASFEDVEGLFGTGKLSPKNEAFLKALAGDDWLGFDYPAQAISAALKRISDFETSAETRKALAALQEGGTRNIVVFDDKLVKITHKDGSPVTAAERKEFLQAAADGSAATMARGQIRFTKGPGPRQFEITLKDSDLSTFLHEMGHYWLERMADTAARPDAPQQIKDDWAATLKFLGVESREQIGTEQHEKFARANELYLMEGKAPSVKLRAIFARFRNWLLQVYERMSRLNVEMSPEIRGVFDRLYATQQEIDQARNAQFLKPLWADRDSAGMTEAEWLAYIGASDAARVKAEEELAADVLEPIRREEQQWWKDKRRAVTEEVTAQVNRRKDIVALTVLRTGKTPDGVEVETPKLSKESLVEDFGLTAESLAKLPKGVYSASGGLSADDLAPMFGYPTGKELIEALAVVPDKKALIKELTEAELKRRYPDAYDDGSIGDKAMRAVHNDKAGELLVREAQLLAEQAGKATTGRTAGLRRFQLSQQMAKAAAQEAIDATALKDIQPAKWKAAEAKAGNEAYKLARDGKLDQAAAAKRRQVLNHFLYREAVRALETVEKRSADLRAFSTKGKREAIGKAGGQEYAVRYRDGTEEVLDSRKAAEEAVAERGGFWWATNTYLEQIDRILERYDLRVRTNKKLASRESLREFVGKLEADGIPHAIPEAVIADARELNYRELPYGFFTGVADAVASIEHVALNKARLMLAGEQRDRDEAAEVIAGGIKGNIKDRLPSIGDADFPEKALDYGNDALSIYLNADYMTRELDGGESGAVNDLLYRPVAEGEVHAVNRKAQANKDIAELLQKHYTDKELVAMRSRRGANAIPVREIGETWHKFNVLKLAFDWGNEGNREAVLRGQYAGGRRITQATVDRLLGLNGQPGVMTENDWKFVQAFAGYINGFWPEIKAKQEARTGVAPKKVEGSPFLTRFGQMPGWYSPLKFDGRQGGKTAQDESDGFLDILNGKHMGAQTARGHTIERIGSGGKPVSMDFEVLLNHVENVITDLELGDAITGVWKLLNHKGVARAFTEAGKAGYHKQMKLWLQDVARGQTIAQSALSRPARAARINFTKAVLTFKVATAVLQQTGHIQSIKVIGPKAWAVGLKQLFTRKWAGKNNLFEQLEGLSPYLKSRWDSGTANAAAYDTMRRAQGDRRPGWLVQSGYWAMLHSQMLVDATTWMGAYNKAITAKVNPKAAVRAADDAVRHAQGSGLFSDRAAIERGTLTESEKQSEFVKSWTTLMSYMMAKGRLAYETTRNTDFKRPDQVAKWTLGMLLIFTAESLVAQLVRGKGPDDEDEDGEIGLTDYAWWAAQQTGLTALGVIPFVNLFGSELQGFRGDVPVTHAMKVFGDVTEQAAQGEVDRALVRAASETVGIFTGLPSGQFNVAMDAFWRASEGEDVSPIEYLMRTKSD
jgi:hypothetical protein